MTHHFDLHHGFITIIQQISRFALVYPDDTEQELSAETQGHGRLVRRDDGLDTVRDIRLQNVILGELALEVGRQPDTGKRPGLLEERLRVEHGGARRSRAGGGAGASRGGL